MKLPPKLTGKTAIAAYLVMLTATAALGAFAGPMAPPLIAGALGIANATLAPLLGILGGMAHDEAKENSARFLPGEHILHNYHLERAVVDAISQYLAKAAKRTEFADDHDVLSLLAANASGVWAEWAEAGSPLTAPLAAGNVSGVLAEFSAAAAVPGGAPSEVLTPEAWDEILLAIETKVGKSLGSATAKALREEFPTAFPTELYAILKHDAADPNGGHAYAGISLLTQGEILSIVRDLKAKLPSDERLANIEAAVKQLADNLPKNLGKQHRELLLAIARIDQTIAEEFAKLYPWLAEEIAELKRQMAREADRVIREVKDEIRASRKDEPSTKPFHLPFLADPDSFIGRKSELLDLRARFASGSAQAIGQQSALSGEGGVGKTRLAVEYAARYRRDYPAGVLTISANDGSAADGAGAGGSKFSAAIDASLAQLAVDELKLAVKEAPQPEAVKAATDWLTSHDGWLLIIDNADSPAAVAGTQALVSKIQGHGHVLIATRHSHWHVAITVQTLETLLLTDALQMLLRGHASASDSERRNALEVVIALSSLSEDETRRAREGKLDLLRGAIPLMIEQAAAVVAEEGMSFAEYLRDWQDEAKRRRLLHRTDDTMNHKIPLDTTVALSMRHLPAEAVALLRLCAWLAPDPIPAWLFEAKEETVFRKAVGMVAAEDGWKPQEISLGPARVRLQRSMLLRRVEGDEASFRLHANTADAIRAAVEDRDAWADMAVDLLNAALPNNPPPQDVRSWHLWNPLGVHAAQACKLADRVQAREELARLMGGLALFLKAKSRFAEAEPIYRRALALSEVTYGEDHPTVAIRLNNFAQLLQATNRLGEAEPLMRRALAIDEASCGKDHPNVALRLNNLAVLFQATTRLAEAEPLMRRALAIDEAAYGKDHPEVAIDLNNLAQLLNATNRLGEAEPMMRRALVIDEASYGKDHPYVASDLNNLAALLQDTNRLGEAEPMMRRALAIDEAAYGKDHPNVAIRFNNLALLLQDTSRLGEAEPMMRRALAIKLASLGPEHPSTKLGVKNLEALLKKMGKQGGSA